MHLLLVSDTEPYRSELAAALRIKLGVPVRALSSWQMKQEAEEQTGDERTVCLYTADSAEAVSGWRGKILRVSGQESVTESVLRIRESCGIRFHSGCNPLQIVLTSATGGIGTTTFGERLAEQLTKGRDRVGFFSLRTVPERKGQTEEEATGPDLQRGLYCLLTQKSVYATTLHREPMHDESTSIRDCLWKSPGGVEYPRYGEGRNPLQTLQADELAKLAQAYFAGAEDPVLLWDVGDAAADGAASLFARADWILLLEDGTDESERKNRVLLREAEARKRKWIRIVHTRTPEKLPDVAVDAEDVYLPQDGEGGYSANYQWEVQALAERISGAAQETVQRDEE